MMSQVVIVGAGPAGMSAALTAAQAGCQVTVLDEGALPGGQIFRQNSVVPTENSLRRLFQSHRKEKLLSEFGAARKTIKYVPQAQVVSAFVGPEIQYVHGHKLHTVRPDALVLATGVREKVVPFDGWTLPGVMTVGGAQATLKGNHTVPGKRLVVAGAGVLPLAVAAQMTRAGADVLALASLHSLRQLIAHPRAMLAGISPVLEGIGYLGSLLWSDVKQLQGYVPISAEGDQRLERVVLAKLGSDGYTIPGSEKSFVTDTLAINYGFEANAELAALLGVAMSLDEVSGWHPSVDEEGRTSVSGVFVCGDGASLRGSYVAQAEGVIVGAAAAAQVRGSLASINVNVLDSAYRMRARHLEFQGAIRTTLTVPARLWSLPSPDTIFCRCEGVRKKKILESIAQGHHSLNAIKRNTRCGMGWCGGRNCLSSVSVLLGLENCSTPQSRMTARAPVRPVSIAELAQTPSIGGSGVH